MRRYGGEERPQALHTPRAVKEKTEERKENSEAGPPRRAGLRVPATAQRSRAGPAGSRRFNPRPITPAGRRRRVTRSR
ncbi:hypothetical protein S1361_03400 [Streptomyces cyanogenus]|uniref:Uncharacterized protein n=1 Tax=Streptomyces cyanogenus TaxID=80860 RepID=A0ABX7TLL5_STRCY|nr:hypothetical protein S1361_03400 [Streptomyces cyanogenus]